MQKGLLAFIYLGHEAPQGRRQRNAQAKEEYDLDYFIGFHSKSNSFTFLLRSNHPLEMDGN